MATDPNPWRGRRVLVTGADGFIGSHLTERLLAAGAQVRAFCWYNSQGSWGWLDPLAAAPPPNLEVVLHDVRDARAVDAACAGVEVIFHLAALIAIPHSYQAAQSYVDTNVGGTLHVLEAARRLPVRRVVLTSTSEVYGTPATLPIRETHPMQAQSPYAATKVAADQLALAYFAAFDVPIVVLRPFNTYGPRQSTRAVLPAMLVQLLSGKQRVELGRLDPRRDLTFVSDTVSGLLRAGCVPDIEGATIQLGSGDAVSVGELFQQACAVLGVKAEISMDPRRLRPDRSEVLVLQSDPSRARELLGWTPQVRLRDGLGQTAAWLRQHLQLYKTDYLHV